jgi:pSer/pThr/pTyr-binding forkhead associated (FHA) protein
MWLVSKVFVAGNLPFRLNVGSFVVGRTKGAAILIKDTTLSRQHARLIRTADSLVIEDLSSRNGTFVNEERITRQTVELGDEIRLGGVICQLAASPLSASDGDESETTSTMQFAAGTTVEFDELTKAQLEVLRLVLQGLDEASIANRLNRSAHTVHTHLKAIFRQFGVHSRAELIVKVVSPRAS